MATKQKKITYPEKFTASGIAQYIAVKNDIKVKQAKEIIEDFLDALQAGVMNGERVPLGKIGKIYIITE